MFVFISNRISEAHIENSLSIPSGDERDNQRLTKTTNNRSKYPTGYLLLQD